MTSYDVFAITAVILTLRRHPLRPACGRSKHTLTLFEGLKKVWGNHSTSLLKKQTPIYTSDKLHMARRGGSCQKSTLGLHSGFSEPISYHCFPCPPAPLDRYPPVHREKSKIAINNRLTTFVASKPIQYEECVTNKSGPTRCAQGTTVSILSDRMEILAEVGGIRVAT
jgi:hypothetical protein